MLHAGGWLGEGAADIHSTTELSSTGLGKVEVGYGRGVRSGLWRRCTKTTWPISRAAPHGRHQARVVICGNMLTAMNGEKEQTPVDKKDNYAQQSDAY